MRQRFCQMALLAITLLLAASAYAAGPIYRLAVDGLACPFCAYGIEKQLLALDGVAKIEIDIAAGASPASSTAPWRRTDSPGAR